MPAQILLTGGRFGPGERYLFSVFSMQGAVSLTETDILYIQDQLQPFRGLQTDLRNDPACQKHRSCRFCRCRGAASRCISQAQFLPALFNVLVQFHLSTRKLSAETRLSKSHPTEGHSLKAVRLKACPSESSIISCYKGWHCRLRPRHCCRLSCRGCRYRAHRRP